MGKKQARSEPKYRVWLASADLIRFWRRNPCIACEDLLGIKLFDAQRYILQSIWNVPHALLCCCRDFGKSFLGAVFMILKALLYPNQAIYIISSVGEQAKETFGKIEEIVTRIGKTSASIRSLKDIAEKETVKSATNKSGFSHNPAGYYVSFYNGSEIFTLNSNPDNNRSRRATLVFFDEAAFCSAELIAIAEAFSVQNSSFQTSIDESYNPEAEPLRVPTQLVYASSQSEMDTTFYRHYKNFLIRMLAGDRDYFVCDMICRTAIETYMDGTPYTPLLTQSKVDAAMQANRDKALREYYNKPTMDGGASQMVKWSAVRRAERHILPVTCWQPGYRYALAFDPSRTNDNSIITVMRIYEDAEYGICGDIVNCVNLVDTASRKKYKLDSNRQLSELRRMLLLYNGSAPDYEHIDTLLIDAGSGGGGTSTYADQLLNSWRDTGGVEHRGLIDGGHELYEGYSARYPDAADILRLVNPKRWRTVMCEEFCELLNLGVLRLPFEWKGQPVMQTVTGLDAQGEEVWGSYELSEAEQLVLANIDLMKNEICNIHRSQNAEKTSTTYALARDKQNTMHDDRFYTAILLAHRLYELRRGRTVRQRADTAAAPVAGCVSVVDFDIAA